MQSHCIFSKINPVYGGQFKIPLLKSANPEVMFLVSSISAKEEMVPQQDDITIEIVDGKEVIHTVSEKPSEEDKDWPIVFHNTITKRDEKGRSIVVETTIREISELSTKAIVSEYSYTGTILDYFCSGT